VVRTRLVLVRHGETVWNAEGRWQGQADVELSDLGRRQAEVTARHLAAAHPDTALVARSDSVRVAATSAPLEALLGVEVVVDRRLREIDVGAWSGRTKSEIRITDPEGWAAYDRGGPVPIGGGERVSDLRARMRRALDDVIGRVGEGTAIVVTHGWALREGVADLLGLTAEEFRPRGKAPNCSVSVLDVGPEAVALATYADDGHLAAAGLGSPARAAGDRA
jgi:probable phosphoglycerate mutase